MLFKSFARGCAMLALLLPGAAWADWHEASSQHFVVYSDDKPERIEAFAAKLERFDKALRFLRNLGDAPVGKANRVTIFVVDDIAEVSRLASNSAAAGFYTPRAGSSFAVVPREDDLDRIPREYREMALTAQQILLHEYTHHFLLSLSPDVAYPAWFVEGYAEFFATAEFEPDGSIIIGHPPQYRVWGLFGENSLSVTKMLTADPVTLNSDQRYMLYGRGWLLTHYLFFGGKRDGQLGDYFRALTEGKSGDEAASAFGDLKALDSELWAYKRTDFGAMRVASSVLGIESVKIRKLSAGEAATMPVRIRSTVGVNANTAPGVYTSAKAASAAYPDDAGAQRVLAEAAYDARDYPAAIAAADRALASQPDNIGALLYKARALIAIASDAKDKSPETWSKIRALIGAANRADIDDPLPLLAYWNSFSAEGKPAPAVAKQGLLYAYELAPQDRGLRFMAAEVHLRDGRDGPARALLATLAADPHAGGLAELAESMVKALDEGHAKAAIAVLDKSRADAAKAASKSK